MNLFAPLPQYSGYVSNPMDLLAQILDLRQASKQAPRNRFQNAKGAGDSIGIKRMAAPHRSSNCLLQSRSGSTRTRIQAGRRSPGPSRKQSPYRMASSMSENRDVDGSSATV